MSGDQGESPEQTAHVIQAAVGETPPEHQQHATGEEQSATGKGSSELLPAQPVANEKGSAEADSGQEMPPEEGDDRSVLEQAAEERRERQKRDENLDGYGPDESLHVGRDWIGQSSSRVYGGGNLNQAGGDIHFTYAGSADECPQIRYMPHRDAEQLEECLVIPPSLDEVKRLLAREPVVFLRGPIGTGRRTVASAALLEWTRASGQAVEPDVKETGEKNECVGLIYGPGSPLRLKKSQLRSGHGYVLDATNRHWIDDLDDHGGHLRDLANKSECRLVVLVPIGRSYPPRPVVIHSSPPAYEVFRRWLEYEALAAGLEPTLPSHVDEAIKADLRGERSPRRAVDLADQMADLLKAGDPPAHILAELPRRACEYIRARLDESRPIIGRCFMASAAVLDGMPEVAVSDAALALANHIDQAWPTKEEERHLPAWEQLRTWLDYADAGTDETRMPGDGQSIFLNRRIARRATLQVLWEDHPTIREPLIDWLHDLAEHDDSDVRLRAAHAAGVLAAFNFEIAAARFLTPWSKSSKLRHHRLAAWMMEAAARDPDLLPRVQDRLVQLANGTVAERMVATHAYGSKIGLVDTPGALRVLRKITFAGNVELSRAVAKPIGYLCSRTTATLILSELADWVGSRSPRARFTAALAFVRLASIGSGDPSRPPLMALQQDGSLNDSLVVLWRNALSLRLPMRGAESTALAVPESWVVLANWVDRYDENLVARQVICNVFGGGRPESIRLRKAFLLHLLHWRRRNSISADLFQRLVRLTKGD